MERLEFNDETVCRLGELIFLNAEVRGAANSHTPGFKAKKERAKQLEIMLTEALIVAQQDTGLDDYNMLDLLGKMSATLHGLFLEILNERKRVEDNE